MNAPPLSRRLGNERGGGRRGLTLVELVVSAAIMGIIMTGLASAILIASHALPSDQNPATALVDSVAVADQIAEELRSAIWIRQHDPTAIAFTVPDRDADGASESISYAWSGTVGDPLQRQYNSGAIVDVLDDVHSFALRYDLETTTEEYPGVPVESSEVLLSSYTGANDLEGYDIDQDDWIGQYFEPSLDPNAVGWKVTRVLFEARARDTKDGQTLVQLRPADPDGLPTATVFEQHTMYESDLIYSYQWQEFAFSDVSGLSPDDGLCLVLQFGAGNEDSARIRYDNHGVSGEFYTDDAGADWTMSADNEMRRYIYGTWSTPGPPQTATRQYVTGVEFGLQVGDDSARLVITRAQTLNTPELLDGWWETGFDTDPTVDYNGDGATDWAVYGGGGFDPNSLSGGVWYTDSVLLNTSPDNDFTSLTTIEVRYRNASLGGNGALFWINVDWSGLTTGPILAYVQLQPDSTQTLTVYRKPDGATTQAIVTVPGLPDDFVTLRLLIDPDLDTVNVQVDGTDYGTRVYTRYALPASRRVAMIGPVGSDVEFDYVSVRVSE